eukprot:4312413-Amphidinium_carterae.1
MPWRLCNDHFGQSALHLALNAGSSAVDSLEAFKSKHNTPGDQTKLPHCNTHSTIGKKKST